jgi:hypothetical protein
MALQLQAVGVPQNDALTEWSARLLVTRDGIPLNGLSEHDFSFLFPWKALVCSNGQSPMRWVRQRLGTTI